jgi:hypothetical protein
MTTRDNVCLTSPQLAEGTDANTYQAAAAFDAVIDNRNVRKAATNNIAFAAFTGTSFTAQAAGTIAAYFFMMNAAGTITVIQSSIKPRPGLATYEAGVWEWPERDGFVCIGALTVRTNGTATFTAGSVDLGATDVVDTFINATPGVTAKPVSY